METVFSDILKLIETRYLPFVRVAEGVGQPSPYDFLVNAIWVEVAHAIQTNFNVIFSPSIPNSFYLVGLKVNQAMLTPHRTTRLR
jgi:hypothetical protein